MSSPTFVMNEALTTYVVKSAEENSLRKDAEISRLAAENTRLKTEQADRLGRKNIADLQQQLAKAQALARAKSTRGPGY